MLFQPWSLRLYQQAFSLKLLGYRSAKEVCGDLIEVFTISDTAKLFLSNRVINEYNMMSEEITAGNSLFG